MYLFCVCATAFCLRLALRDWDRVTVCSIIPHLAAFSGIKVAHGSAFRPDLIVIKQLLKVLVTAVETANSAQVRDIVSQMVNAAGLSA